MADEEAQILQVCVRVAYKYVEDQPLEKLCTRDRRRRTQIGQSCQLLDAARGVLVGPIQAEQLAGIDAMNAAPALSLVASVEALDQVYGLRDVAALDGGHVQFHPRGQGHHEPFVYYGVGV